MSSPRLSDWNQHGFVWGGGLAAMLTCDTCGCIVDLSLWMKHRHNCPGPHGNIKKKTTP